MLSVCRERVIHIARSRFVATTDDTRDSSQICGPHAKTLPVHALWQSITSPTMRLDFKARLVLLFALVGALAIYYVNREGVAAEHPHGQDVDLVSPINSHQQRIFEQYYPSPRNRSRHPKYGNSNLNDAYSDAPLGEDVIYIYKAFYDTRDPAGPRIRVILTANCATLASGDVVIELRIANKSIGIGWVRLPFEGALTSCLGDDCPYHHYDIASEAYEGAIPETVTFHRDDFIAEIPIERSPAEYSDDISACLGGMHWYNDWPRLIFYVEMVRRNGISRILVPWQQKGIIDLHPWPLMPFGKKHDPNKLVFYNAQWLLTQYCNFWTKSKYTYLSDVDEMLYVRDRNWTLYELLESWSRNASDLGGFNFPHTPLSLDLAQEPFDYEKFLELEPLRMRPRTVVDDWRFPKSVWITEHTMVSWVHYATEFFADKRNYDIPAEEALDLHMRNDFIGRNYTDLYPDVQIFSEEEVEGELSRIRGIIREIFRDLRPNYRTPAVHAAMEKPGKPCDDSGVGCWELLSRVDDWIYASPTPESFYIPV
ncbi:unnamed protein product, partial [Mesorhabditis spiculigera]